MDIGETECGHMNWVELVQDKTSWPAFVKTVKKTARNFLTSCVTMSRSSG
jgi:hypothetical protein